MGGGRLVLSAKKHICKSRSVFAILKTGTVKAGKTGRKGKLLFRPKSLNN